MNLLTCSSMSHDHMTVTALNSSKPSRYDYLLEVIDDELVQRPTTTLRRHCWRSARLQAGQLVELTTARGQQRGEPSYHNPCLAYIIKNQKSEAKKPLRGIIHAFCRKSGFIRDCLNHELKIIPTTPAQHFCILLDWYFDCCC